MRSIRVFSLGLAILLSAATFAQSTLPSTDGKVDQASAIYKSGKLEEAIKAFEDLKKQYPTNPQVKSWLGFLYLRANTPEKALVELLDAKASLPSDLEVLNNLGNAYLALGQNDKALESYALVKDRDSRRFEPYYNSGTIYLKKKAYAKAVEEFLSATKLKDTDAFAFNNLGVAYDGIKDSRKAADAFRAASDMRKDNKLFARNAGLMLNRLGDNQNAITYLERAVVNGESDAAPILALADVYSKTGRSGDALKLLESGKEPNSGNAILWFNLGVLRAMNQDIVGSEAAYKRALAINPNDLDTLNNLGLSVFKRGQFEESEMYFDKLVGLNPTSTAAKLNLASAAARAGDLKKAIIAWREVLKVEPQRLDIRLDMANAQWEARDVEGAKANYLQILASDKNNTEALNGIGLYHLRASKFAPAEAAFRVADEMPGLQVRDRLARRRRQAEQNSK